MIDRDMTKMRTLEHNKCHHRTAEDIPSERHGQLYVGERFKGPVQRGEGDYLTRWSLIDPSQRALRVQRCLEISFFTGVFTGVDARVSEALAHQASTGVTGQCHILLAQSSRLSAKVNCQIMEKMWAYTVGL